MEEHADPQQSQSISRDQMELLKFLRDEAESNRRAQREESDANRKLFLDGSKIVAIPLAVMLTLAGIFFYRDINTMKEAMKTEAEAEAHSEIKRMDANIDKTLEDRFKSENIQKTIQNAALEATTKQAPDLIREVITPEVRKAVQAQIGTIRDVATQAATTEVHGAIDPVVADVRLQGLIAKATSDDAQSFDQLLAMKNSGSGTPSERELIDRVIANLEHNSQAVELPHGQYSDCAGVNGTEYRAKVTSAITAVANRAIGACVEYMFMGQWAPKIPGNSESAFTVMETISPLWIEVAMDSPSLATRATAVRALNWLFNGGPDVPQTGFDLIDTAPLKRWWNRHEPTQAAVALVAYTNGINFQGPNGINANGIADFGTSRARLDEIGLYDEAERLANLHPVDRALLEQLRERMRMAAATPRMSPPDLAREMGRGCGEVEQDLGLRLTGFAKMPEQERVDGYALLELQYLEQNCTVAGIQLTGIAEYGIATRSLSSRYAAVKIINRSTGTSLNPFDPQALKEWLKVHQQHL